MSSSVPIYAVDFDGTLCESKWPDIGAPNKKLIRHLIQRREEGAKLILWTCRIDEKLQEAVDWCKKFGLEFDAVNDNLPENVERYGNNTRKIWATCYIDDLAVDKDKYGLPFHAESELDQSRNEREKFREIGGDSDNKGVLIVDMPQSCSKCRFLYEFCGKKKCQLLNIMKNGSKAIIPIKTLTTERKDCCPLMPMTESEIDKYVE